MNNAQRQIFEKTVWFWFYTIPKIIQYIFIILACLSLILLIVRGSGRWYHPIILAVGAGIASLTASSVSEMMLFSCLHLLLQVDCAFNPFLIRSFQTSILKKHLIFIEQFEKPAGRKKVSVFVFQLLVIIYLICVFVLFTLYPVLSWKGFAIYIAVGFILLFLSILVHIRLSCFKAYKRWAGMLRRQLDQNENLKNEIISNGNLTEEELDFWVLLQISLLVKARINPDHVNIAEWPKYTVIK
jgi:hypothetical protein